MHFLHVFPEVIHSNGLDGICKKNIDKKLTYKKTTEFCPWVISGERCTVLGGRETEGGVTVYSGWRVESCVLYDIHLLECEGASGVITSLIAIFWLPPDDVSCQAISARKTTKA